MGCNYKYNEWDTQNILDLAKVFYKNTRQLDPSSAIFSSEDIQETTVNILRTLETSSEAIKNSDLTNINDFITNSNFAPILHDIGVDIERLAPEYIEDNYLPKFIEKSLEKDSSPNFNVTDLPKVDSKKLSQLIDKFPSIDKNILIYYLSKFEEDLDITDKTKDFSNNLHQLINIAINDKFGIKSSSYVTKLNTFIKSNPDIFGVGLDKEWITKLNFIIQNIITLVSQTGVPITNLTLSSGINDKAKIKGNLELLAVDKYGNAHIFIIKVSKSEYKDWNDAKLLELDWQLALSKQLLSKHIDVKNTMLQVIPIQFQTLKDPNSLIYRGSENRQTASRNGLVEGGRLTTIARKLIPDVLRIKYNEDKLEKFKSDLDGLIPSYKIKTTRDNYNIDKIVENAKKKGFFSYFNQFSDSLDSPSYGKKYIRAESEEDFRKKITSYVEYAKLQENLALINLKKAINSVLLDPVQSQIKLNNSKQEVIANRIFKDYLRGDWELIESIPEADSLGLILMKNNFTNTIDVISLSTYNDLAEYSDIDNLLYGDLEYIKSFLFLNSYKNELFLGRGNKIGNIITYNPYNDNNKTFRTTKQAFSLFVNRMTNKGRSNDILLNETEHLVSFERNTLDNVRNSLINYQGSHKNELEGIFKDVLGYQLNDLDLTKLLEINKDFIKTFPEFNERQLNPVFNFEDPKEYLYGLLQTSILAKYGVHLSGDFIGMTNFAVQFSDFGSLLGAIFNPNQKKYNKNGKLISGIMGGLTQVTPDLVGSKDLRNINMIIANINSKIGQKMVDESSNIHNITMKYYNAIGFSNFSRNVLGETQSKYKHLFISDGDSISREFKTKNPYINNSENALTSAERQFLKEILFEIQKYTLNLNSIQISKIDPNSIESLRSNERIAKAIDSGDYFKIPLVRREELTKHKGLFQHGLYGFWQLVKDRIKDTINNLIDPRELDSEEMQYVNTSAVGFSEMYDLYGRQTDEYKAKVIEKHGVDYFEWNLDTIAHRVAFNKIRKYQFDSKLPIINAYIWWIKIQGGKENEELDKVMEYIKNQLKLAAFDEPIIEDEFKDVIKVTSVLKKISTAGMLAFRPVLLIKELTLGVMKGCGIAATQIYGKDQFTLNDLRQAYTKFFTINDKFSSEYNLLENLNHFYRFANMDANTISRKLQSDRMGLVRGFGRYMYAMNTMPDYYNRLSLFIAKMIHDGSYNAHSIVDGKIVYNPKNDDRFKYYLENREKYKDSKGNYIPAKNDIEYNKQRNIYILLQEQLNIENAGENIPFMKEVDLINKAYSEQERASFKSFTDTAYGYYDKDSSSQLTQTWYGIIWLQFMQFWPGKMHQWFGIPSNKKDPDGSPIGRMKQKTIMEDGEEKLLWRKAIYKDDNPEEFDRFEEVTENTGDPAYAWTGTPQEGLAYSILYTLHDIFTLNFKDALGNKERLQRCAFAIHDAVLMAIIAGIIKAILGNIIADEGTDGLSGNVLNFAATVNQKVLRETNIYQNTLGALNSEPVFLNYGQKLATDLQSMMLGDKSVQEVMGRDIGAFEFLKDYNPQK